MAERLVARGDGAVPRVARLARRRAGDRVAARPCGGDPRRRAREARRRCRRRSASALEAVTAQILAKLLHEPTVRMKQAAADGDGEAYAAAIRRLFAPRRRAVALVIRVGSRGSPARADAGGAGSVDSCARPGSRGRVPADHDGGRPRPLQAVRADRRARRVREGARGGAARRAHRRRRTLRQGHDLDGHGRPHGGRVSRARRPARRARRRRAARAGHADRHRVDPPPRAAARARPDDLGRAAPRQHRHASAQGTGARPRRAGARGLRPRPARARRPRSARGSTSR